MDFLCDLSRKVAWLLQIGSQFSKEWSKQQVTFLRLGRKADAFFGFKQIEEEGRVRAGHGFWEEWFPGATSVTDTTSVRDNLLPHTSGFFLGGGNSEIFYCWAGGVAYPVVKFV